jgi:hypothetical protein
MKAIAYIKSDQADPQDPYGSIFEKQKKSVVSYCHENDLELLEIFEEDQHSPDAGAASWNQMEGYLNSQYPQIDVLIVNSLDHLGYNPQVLSDKLSYLSTHFKITVVCLTDQFIGNVVNELNDFEDVATLKKEIAELLLLYLVTFRSQVVTFTVEELARFSSKETSLFMQPCDTFQNPFNLAGLSTVTESDNFHFDCNVYLSLLESTLLLLLSRSMLRSQTVVSPHAGKAIVTKGYTILSELLKSDNDEEFFAREFTVTFSNDFWADLKLK